MVQTSNHSDVPSTQLGSETQLGGPLRALLDSNRHSQDIDLTHLSGSGTEQSNGLIEIAYSPEAAKSSRARDSRQQGSSEDLNTALSKLSADAAKTMDSAHRAEFMNELHGFLSQAKLKNLSDDKVVRTLEATAKMLEGVGAKPLNQFDRVALATSLMHNVNHCDRIDQGFHNTCNVTAISKVLLANDPATYAEMLSSTALNSYYQASDGKRISVDAQSLQPDHESASGETMNAKRNYATQIFDLVAINNYWQRRIPPFSYVQRQSTGAGDTGERLLNSFGQPIKTSDGRYLDQPSLDCVAMAKIGTEVGIKENFLIANRATDAGAGAIVSSATQLDETLKDMLSKGHPAMIFVHSGNKLFTGKYGIGGGGWHVVTIDSYDPSKKTFHLSNQWGAGNDQDVSAELLYDATLPPSQWAKVPDYFNAKIFQAYHEQMADGGAGLSTDQVLTRGAFEQFLSTQKDRMQKQDIDAQLADLQRQLDAARAAGNEAEVHRLQDWIRQTRDGLR
jgi:hypothetical protein